MKTTFLSLIALFAAAVQADELAIPHITVFGESRSEVAPDEMVWQLEVRTEGADIAKVAEAQDSAVRQLLGFLQANGIEDKNIQTSRAQLSEKYEYRAGTQFRAGYFAHTSVTFTSTQLDKYRELWIGLAKLSNVSVSSTGWSLSNRHELVAEAQANAIQNARSKAVSMVAGLNAVKVEEPLRIEELGDGGHPQPMDMRMMTAEAAFAGNEGPSSSPGTIELVSRVRATFRLVSYP